MKVTVEFDLEASSFDKENYRLYTKLENVINMLHDLDKIFKARLKIAEEQNKKIECEIYDSLTKLMHEGFKIYDLPEETAGYRLNDFLK